VLFLNELNIMQIEQLLKQRSELSIALNTLNEQISDYSDGFIYVATMESFGQRWFHLAKNKYAMSDFVKKRQDKDDYCALEIWTNCNEFNLPDYIGTLYRINEASDIKHALVINWLKIHHSSNELFKSI
jgi:hypothetical protein